MPSKYDLHTHSRVSDGILSPSELVARAAAGGVEVLALTDHDDTAGLAEAAQAAQAAGIRLIQGVEISTTWQAATIHLVGLGIDPGYPPLLEGLERLRAFRDWRAEEIGRRLAARGIHGAYEGARALAEGRIVSRTHFARWLSQNGCGKTVQEVFKHYLKRNKPGYVPGQWASVEEAVAWVRGAGGVAVIAHPARYDFTTAKLKRLIAAFTAAGGEGIEVLSSSHSADDVARIARLAVQFGLLASVGSDFHDPALPWIALGRLGELPPDCRPVWQGERWPLAPVAGEGP